MTIYKVNKKWYYKDYDKAIERAKEYCRPVEKFLLKGWASLEDWEIIKVKNGYLIKGIIMTSNLNCFHPRCKIEIIETED